MRPQTLLLWLVSIIGAMLVSLVLLLFLFKVNIVASGYGVIVPARRVKIKPEPQSVIKEVVRRRGVVKEDEVILRLNRSTAEAMLVRAEKEIKVLEAQLGTVKAKSEERACQAKARIAAAEAELARARARLEELKKSPLTEEIAAAEEQLKQEHIEQKAAETIYNDTLKLFRQGLVSKLECDERRKTLDLAKSEVEEKKNELDRLRTKLVRDDIEKAKAEERKARAELDLARIVESSKEEIKTIEARIEKAKVERDMCAHDLEKRDFRAPIGGELVGFEDIGIGERVLPSSPPLGEIIDRSTVIFKAMIQEVDIADVEIGQKALVYLDAYPYRKFREFDGEVIEIAPVAAVLSGRHGNAPVCEVRIRMAPTDGYEFKPGMAGQVEVIVDHDRAVYWLLGVDETRRQARRKGTAK